MDVAMYGIVFGVIGARIYYVAFSWDMYKDDLKSILNLREGGLAIYGGVIAAIITVIVFCKCKKLSAPLLFDTVGVGLGGACRA
jgi:phosphatidylglycerol:prolipoprotein diacylglycerol transferase